MVIAAAGVSLRMPADYANRRCLGRSRRVVFGLDGIFPDGQNENQSLRSLPVFTGAPPQPPPLRAAIARGSRDALR